MAACSSGKFFVSLHTSQRATIHDPFEPGWRQEPRPSRPRGPDWLLLAILGAAFLVAVVTAAFG